MSKLASVLVEPLEPPFSGSIMRFSFEGYDKELAVSKADGEKIIELLGGDDVRGRTIVVSAEGDTMIRVRREEQ